MDLSGSISYVIVGAGLGASISWLSWMLAEITHRRYNAKKDVNTVCAAILEMRDTFVAVAKSQYKAEPMPETVAPIPTPAPAPPPAPATTPSATQASAKELREIHKESASGIPLPDKGGLVLGKATSSTEVSPMPPVRKFPFPAQWYNYYVEGYPQPFTSLRAALSAAVPATKEAGDLNPEWSKLPTEIRDKIRREKIERTTKQAAK